MQKIWKAFGVFAALAALTIVCERPIMARLTGTDPGSDIFCVGPSGAEVCIDASGNVIPTTTNDASLGTSSLRFSNVYSTLLNISGAATLSSTLAVTGTASLSGGSIGKVATAQSIASGSTIAADSCGGLKRITSSAAVSTVAGAFTAPTLLSGCAMDVMNVGTATITLATSSVFMTANAVNLALPGTTGVRVHSDGSAWYVIGTTNH